jgi:hypothetical protein
VRESEGESVCVCVLAGPPQLCEDGAVPDGGRIATKELLACARKQRSEGGALLGRERGDLVHRKRAYVKRKEAGVGRIWSLGVL